MKVAYLNDDVAQVRDVPAPTPGPGELVVRVERAALHQGDLLGSGDRPLGLEGAGVVEAVGPGVHLESGTRVAVFPAPGVVAERVTVPAEHAFAVEPDVEVDAAAQLFVNPITAEAVLRSLSRSLTDPPGARPLIVSGAASAVGQFIVLRARQLGHRVIAISRSARSAAKIAERHDVEVFASNDDDWARGLAAAVGDDGALAVLDGVGGVFTAEVLGLLPVHAPVLFWGDLSGQPLSGVSALDLLPLERELRGVSVLRWAVDETTETRAADVARAQLLTRQHHELFAVADRFRLDEVGDAVERVRTTRGDGTVLVDLTL